MSISRRMGKFSIARRVIEDDPEVVMSEIMARCVVVRAEMMWEQDSIEYTATSPDFAMIAEGEIIPWYDVDIVGPNARFIRRTE